MRLAGATLHPGSSHPGRSRYGVGDAADVSSKSRLVSAVPGSIVLPEVPGTIDEHGADKKPPIRATIYFFVIGVVAAAATFPLLPHLKAGTHSWATFIILGSAAAVAQLFVVRTPRNQSYHTTVVFLIPAVMLLPPDWAGEV